MGVKKLNDCPQISLVPNHLDTLDTVEVVRTIREAIKK